MTTNERTLARDHLRHVCDALGHVCDVALLSLPSSTTYLAGYLGSRVPAVTSATNYGSAFVAVDARGSRVFLGAPRRDKERFDSDLVAGVGYFDGFVQDRELSARESHDAALDDALTRAGADRAATIGVEARHVPLATVDWLRRAYPKVQLVDVEAALLKARGIKTERDRLLLRRANEVADIAHARFAELVSTPGRREIDVWAEVRTAVEVAAGGPGPLEGELVSGPRTAVVRYPGGPTERRMETGDAAILDLSASIGGYWFDCTNTHIVGRTMPTDARRRLIDVARRAFDAAVGRLRPGARARDVWAAGAKVYRDAGVGGGLYFGHQIGVEVNEVPRIVAFDDTVLEPGMAFEIEPGVYEGEGGDFGCRFEKTVFIGEREAEVINHFAWGLGTD